jgi:hypothetical protein
MICPMPRATHEDGDLARSMVCWGRVPVLSTMYTQVATSRLIATQAEVSEVRLAKLLRVLRHESVATADIGAIDIAQIGQRLIIVDGHHRATAAIQLGWRRIMASIRKRHAQPSSNQETKR